MGAVFLGRARRPLTQATLAVSALESEAIISTALAPRVQEPGVHTAAIFDPVAVYLAQLSANSRRAVLTDLTIIAGILSRGEANLEGLPWHLLRYEHVAAVRQRLAEKYAPASANRMLSSLRGVLRESWNLGLLSAEEYQRAIRVKPVNGSRLPAGRALTAGELRTLFRACAEDDRPAGVRDAALLAVLYSAGLRRAEAVQLDMADFHPESGEIRVRSGKGSKDRLTYVQGLASTAVEVWLDVRGSESGPLFVPIHRTGNLQARRPRGSRRSRRTTSGAPSRATCWTPGPTSAPCNSSLGTQA